MDKDAVVSETRASETWSPRIRSFPGNILNCCHTHPKLQEQLAYRQKSTTFKLPKRELQHAVFLHLWGWAGAPSLLHAPVQQLWDWLLLRVPCLSQHHEFFHNTTSPIQLHIIHIHNSQDGSTRQNFPTHPIQPKHARFQPRPPSQRHLLSFHICKTSNVPAPNWRMKNCKC